ncbi:MAG TPA: SURF1 family protein [Steroidobacteraceae bacterium]|nr:SURF1 family protein [Steroidobacteraceae bacterium]
MKRIALVVLAGLGTLALVGLGVWQLERRDWKLALIERVDRRVHAAPVRAPGPDAWAGLNKENAEYLHVSVTGRFLEGRDTLVRAVTALGGGYWMMTPLQTDDGFVVLVNRGFVPAEQTDAASPSLGATGRVRSPAATDGRVTITGLLRITEPNGGFLHSNAPRENRWYSRDVVAIAQARGLSHVAPYFIDADARANESAPPIGGLTVITFHNSHLIYAITWFALALMLAVLGVRIARTPETRHA